MVAVVGGMGRMRLGAFSRGRAVVFDSVMGFGGCLWGIALRGAMLG
jgi:hypothetical protein